MKRLYFTMKIYRVHKTTTTKIKIDRNVFKLYHKYELSRHRFTPLFSEFAHVNLSLHGQQNAHAPLIGNYIEKTTKKEVFIIMAFAEVKHESFRSFACRLCWVRLLKSHVRIRNSNVVHFANGVEVMSTSDAHAPNSR